MFLTNKIMERKQTFHNDLTVPGKFHYCSKWRHDQDAVFWINLEETQDLQLEFWQTKSNAIVVLLCTIKCHHKVFLKVIAKNNMRTIFERSLNPNQHRR